RLGSLLREVGQLGVPLLEVADRIEHRAHGLLRGRGERGTRGVEAQLAQRLADAGDRALELVLGALGLVGLAEDPLLGLLDEARLLVAPEAALCGQLGDLADRLSELLRPVGAGLVLLGERVEAFALVLGSDADLGAAGRSVRLEAFALLPFDSLPHLAALPEQRVEVALNRAEGV